MANPYQKPFARGVFFHNHLARFPDVHNLRRSQRTAYFRNRNPRGYLHDLGAQDAFVDNLGVLALEQFSNEREETRYMRSIGDLLSAYDRATHVPINANPWWGRYLNSNTRVAASGEPRPIIRLMETEPTLPAGVDAGYRGAYEDWQDGSRELFEPVTEESPLRPRPAERRRAMGLELPEEFRVPVESLRLVSPLHSTPDLPPRVRPKLSMLQEVLHGRDQGELPTCGSFATVFALEVASRNAALRTFRLSPAWLHLSSGAREEHRTLQRLLEVVSDTLPCREGSAPYAELLSGELGDRNQFGARVGEDSRTVNESWGPPRIRTLDRENISLMKTLLAAGWVLIAATRITENFFRRPFAMSHGLALQPLLGEAPAGGHGWCIVGYDHVDGGASH